MDLHLTLTGGPKRAQLERQLRDGVRSGRLRPGARLPPSRTLARDLGVSRGVVVEAYAQLTAEGWLTARRGAGTTVAAIPKNAEGPAPSPLLGRVPTFGEGAGLSAKVGIRFDLRTGRPDLSAFPRAAWHAAVGRALKALPDADLDYGDPRGYGPLREALAEQLGRTRGVLADPEHVVVCGGLYPGLTVLLRALRRRGARCVAVEDPGWRGQVRAAEQAGIAWTPVRVDEHGIVVDELGDADVVVVTPAHQFPTGVVLAPARRAQLIAWARDRGALIVEDDYDAEYRYDREPVGAVQALAPDRVLYAGSASKSLAPALRLGWLVAPPWLAADLADEKDRADRGTPVLDQAALADLVSRGEVDRHLRRTRRRYRARRDALVAALATDLPEVRVGGAAAGLHVVAWLPDGADEERIADAALDRGVAVDRLHHGLTTVAAQPPALLLGYAAHTETALGRAVALLATATASARSGSASRSPRSGSRAASP
jgi:GntR family transcriptional regulator/MocR family aminotransferase